MLNYPENIKNVVHIAESTAKEYSNDAVEPAHLLKAVLHKDFGLADAIEGMGKDYYYLIDWAETRISLIKKATKAKSDLMLSDASAAVMEEADNYKIKFGKDEADPICLFASLCTPGVGFSYEQLKTFPVNNDEVSSFAEKTQDPRPKTQDKKVNIQQVPNKALNSFCIDKLSLYQDASTTLSNHREKIIGLEKDILTIMEILGRKTKSNVLIIGESGVGKTSLINGFVQRVALGNVPDFLKNIQIFELDFGSFIAGASYKGEAEDRFKKIADEIKTFDRAILIIEGIENIFDKHGPLSGVSSIIKQELGKGGFIMMGSCSVGGFTKNIESDSDFNGKFEKLRMEEPTDDKTYRILSEIVPGYETHHKVKTDDKTLHEAIRLSKRYLREKFLPSSAIDLLDRSMSLVNTMNNISADEIKHLQNKLEDITSPPAPSPNGEGKGKKDEVQQMNEINWLYQELNDRVSHSQIAQVDEGVDFAELKKPADKLKHIKNMLDKLSKISSVKKEKVDEFDLTMIISQLSGVPMGKVSTKERDKLINAEDFIKRRVCGQDHVIKTLLEAIYESRSGLSKKGQPMGSFFFLGPTGTGKTEMAKTLAEFLFQDESSMIRFDMSEFKEEHSAALLYGAPPGYVGYEEGGLLVNKIRQKPYSVVLFDEIEKAHASVFDIFLQILDEGKLHDKLGREGDFSNALILFTSNIGSDFIFKSFEENVIPDSGKLTEIMSTRFRPEFLGRLTEIVPFAPISEELALKIFDVHYKKLLITLKEMEINLKIDDATRKELANSGFSRQFGARPIIGVVRNSIRRPLSKLLISGKIAKGSTVELKYDAKGKKYDWKY